VDGESEWRERVGGASGEIEWRERVARALDANHCLTSWQFAAEDCTSYKSAGQVPSSEIFRLISSAKTAPTSGSPARPAGGNCSTPAPSSLPQRKPSGYKPSTW
jgi:hypothetical protein